ncbi:sugar kinase [Bacillus sp. CECT 9360]|uniref:sugar kinase n=1 Tax=Bacillus sp. CECT 9360 TaxID=2845821 RepID=UPI001E371C8C|nr:sugar kinase [Bacillus sp. CECT 9360]CAH0343844.1 2-dehydro-3-deoxygluconokinase [Bacillus sp. CECT 9360]
MHDIVTIGDAMITFNPVNKGPMRFVHQFERRVGGAELNVAIGCARLGLNVGWISCLGNDEFGKHILHFIKGEGIDTSQIQFAENIPTSLNFKEIMEDGSGRTFYYRKPSPTSLLTAETLPYDYLGAAKVFHISGVFAALDSKNVDLLLHATLEAKKQGALISFDPNIRLKLWASKDEMKMQLLKFLPLTDILLIGEEEADLLLHEKNPDRIFQLLSNENISWIVIKQAERGCVCYWNGKKYIGNPENPGTVVDTVGAGDGFASGFLYGIINKLSIDETLRVANSIGAMVVSVSGDNEGLPLLEDVQARLGIAERIER